MCMRSFSPLSLFLRELKSSQICVHMFVARPARWFLDMPQSAPPQTMARRQGSTGICVSLATVRGGVGWSPWSGLPLGSLGGPVCARRAPSFLRLPLSAPPSAVSRATPFTTVLVPSRSVRVCVGASHLKPTPKDPLRKHNSVRKQRYHRKPLIYDI